MSLRPLARLSLLTVFLLVHATLCAFPLWLDAPARTNPGDPRSQNPQSLVPPTPQPTPTPTPCVMPYPLVREFGSFGSGVGQMSHDLIIQTDAGGNVYLGDRQNHKILVFDASGVFVGEFAVTFLSTPFGPAAMAVDKASSAIYVGVHYGGFGRLRKYSAAGGELANFTDTSGSWGPNGMCVSGAGTLFVTGGMTGWAVRTFNSSLVQTGGFGAFGLGTYEFQNASDIAVDSTGRAFVTDNYWKAKVFSPPSWTAQGFLYTDLGSYSVLMGGRVDLNPADGAFSYSGGSLQKVSTTPQAGVTISFCGASIRDYTFGSNGHLYMVVAVAGVSSKVMEWAP